MLDFDIVTSCDLPIITPAPDAKASQLSIVVDVALSTYIAAPYTTPADTWSTVVSLLMTIATADFCISSIDMFRTVVRSLPLTNTPRSKPCTVNPSSVRSFP
jgi:hypothetical protein